MCTGAYSGFYLRGGGENLFAPPFSVFAPPREGVRTWQGGCEIKGEGILLKLSQIWTVCSAL